MENGGACVIGEAVRCLCPSSSGVPAVVVEHGAGLDAFQITVVVRDENQRDPRIAQGTEGEFDESFPAFAIKAVERFVEQGDRRAAGEDAGEADSGPFAAGERVGTAFGEGLRLSDGEGGFDSSARLVSVESQARDRHGDVVPAVQMVVEGKMLFDEPDVATSGGHAIRRFTHDLDRATVGSFEPGDDREQRALAAARWPFDRVPSARSDLEIDRADAATVPESALDTPESQRGSGHPADFSRADRRRRSSASMNGCRAPSSTVCGLPASWPVRWSFTRLS